MRLDVLPATVCVSAELSHTDTLMHCGVTRRVCERRLEGGGGGVEGKGKKCACGRAKSGRSEVAHSCNPSNNG